MASFLLLHGFIAFLSTALSIWSIVCMWIIFKKAGREGWESLIPIWNIYILFKIAGKTSYFWVLVALPILMIIYYALSWTILSGDNSLIQIFGIVLSGCYFIIPLICWLELPYGLTKKFGKSNWFYIGMLFLTPIFFGILAFGDAKYEGVEFNEKYNLKKWLLITLGISLFIGCCNAGIKYYQYRTFYDFDYDYDYNYNHDYNYNYDYNYDEIDNNENYNDNYSTNYDNSYNNGVTFLSKDECYTEDGILNNNPDKDSEGNIINCYNSKGKEHGKWLGYNGYGIAIQEMNYIDGKQNGKEIRTWPNTGKLRYEVNYINGLREGEGKSYYQSGELEFIENYINGKLDGKKEFFYEDGQTKKIEYYDKGTLIGTPNNYPQL